MVDGNHLGQKNYSFREGQIVYINESGLYSLILSSHAPFAKEFKRLVCKTILPSIRKFGSFQVESPLANAVAQLTIKDKYEEELRLRAEKLESQLEEQRLLKAKVEIEAKEKLQGLSSSIKRPNKSNHKSTSISQPQTNTWSKPSLNQVDVARLTW
jgi:prophage antirepressor-like protein